ncbi:MAG: TonB-dependent receptor plug domain-containing protein, partial [Bacteroidales bacterium]|nr:TonB-dependent receptor plug domain-containing protein [Bacteroidales bacterium]
MKQKLSISIFFILFFVTIGFSQEEVKWEHFINKYPIEKIYLHTDRTFYQPGERIWFKLYVTDAALNLQEALSEVAVVELLNPRGGVEKTFSIYIKNGIGAGSYWLSQNASGGQYKLRAYTAWIRNFDKNDAYTKELFVQKAQMPLLLMNLDFDRKAYSAGDEIKANLEVKTQQNEPLSNYPISYVVNVEGKNVHTANARTDRNGKIALTAILPQTIHSADGILNVMINYEGSTEAVSRSIPLVLNSLNLQFFPEGGYLVENVEGNLAFKITNEFGKPADAEGEIRDSSDKLIVRFRSEWMGLGSVDFTPQQGEKYYAVITSPQGITQRYNLPKALKTAYSMRVSNHNKSTLKLIVHTPHREPYFVTITSGETLITQDFTGAETLGQHLIDVSSLPFGIARVTLLNRQGVEQCERLIYIGERAPMNIQITTDKTEYLPGEEVTLDIETYDANNNPLSANLSLTVIDDKIHAFADDRQDNILSWLLMSSELKDKVEDASYYFNPTKEKAMQSIDYVLLTHGWRRFTWHDVNNPNIDIKSPPTSLGLIGGTVRYKESKTGVQANVWLVSYGQEKTVAHLRTNESGKFLFTNVDRSGKLQLIANAVHYNNRGIEIDTLSLDLRAIQKELADSSTVSRVRARTGIILEGEKVAEGKKTDTNEMPDFIDINNATALEETVVVGYGVATRNNLTSSVSTVSKDPFSLSISNVSTVLQGSAAGVAVTDASPGAGENISIRGIGSYDLHRTPLYVIDGMPVENINNIPSEGISSITILKDASATAIYGSRGANGVIIITTKRTGNRWSRNLPKYKTLGKEIKYAPQYVSVVIPAADATTALHQTYNPYNYVKPTRQSRTDFRRTLYWNPNINTDTLGKASVKLYNSDAVGGFRVIAEGIGGNKPGHGEMTYFTNLPFSITTKLPAYFCFGDMLQLPVILKNQTDKPLKGTLISSDYYYFKLMDNYTKEKNVEIAPHSTTTVYIPYQVNYKHGETHLYTSFKGKGVEDRVGEQVEIVPKGFPTQASFASTDSTASYRFVANKPIDGSMQGNFVMNADVLQQMILGSNSIIREPNGCFEQTTSKLFIDAAALNYLVKTKKNEPKIEKLLRDYIKKGYSKILSYENAKGGFGWFGDGIANITLTAKCLMHLVEMKSFGIAGLDNEIIVRTKNYLLDHRDRKGNFIQEESKYRYSTPNSAVTNAYTVYALSEAGIKEIKTEYNAAVEEALKSKDIYRLALLANAACNFNEYDIAEKLLAELHTIVDKQGYDRAENSNSITYSWGRSYNTEVNALHLSALLKSPTSDKSHIQQVYAELMKSRSNYGFGSTQATLLALKAIIDYDVRYPVVFDKNPKVTLTINNKVIEHNISLKNLDIRIDSLQKYSCEGENIVQISYSGVKNASYGLNFSWTSLTPNSSPNCMVDLSTKIDNENKNVGETARLTTVVQNKTDSPLPMTVALIGIPAGASPQHWQLKEIQEKAQADFVEIDKNYVIFYFTGMNPNEKRTINLDLRVEVPGIFQAPASNAYLYYTNEYKVWNDGVRLQVAPE